MKPDAPWGGVTEDRSVGGWRIRGRLNEGTFKQAGNPLLGGILMKPAQTRDS